MSDLSKLYDSLRLNSELLSSINPIPKELTESIAMLRQTYQQSSREIQQQLRKISFPLSDLTRIQYEPLIASIRPIQEALDITLVSDIYHTFAINDAKLFQGDLDLLTSALKSIHIHDDYVSVPEVLIPDDFQYEEVPDTSSIGLEQNAEQTANTKNLSLPNAWALLNLFTSILFFLLAPFYNHAIENFLSEKEEVISDTPITEEQVQQMLEYLSELTDYQQDILIALETSLESVQGSVSVPPDIGLTPSGTDSTSSNADSDSQRAPSSSDPAEESHPTEVDDSENFESHQQPVKK